MICCDPKKFDNFVYFWIGIPRSRKKSLISLPVNQENNKKAFAGFVLQKQDKLLHKNEMKKLFSYMPRWDRSSREICSGSFITVSTTSKVASKWDRKSEKMRWGPRNQNRVHSWWNLFSLPADIFTSPESFSSWHCNRRKVPFNHHAQLVPSHGWYHLVLIILTWKLVFRTLKKLTTKTSQFRLKQIHRFWVLAFNIRKT